ncbi:hypothetical protein PVAP13_1NG462857 [Panicum virgatum]|uniref:Uncharacterized protein n=2 Tax=Panicum virgatum TaxID=38727 RepID=A0A8T0WUV1_PANVG|nr:hypothetical protein PVAP13_1NG462857 [Panicum virgatum]KAG2650618.1 hypothetical protein PVAP13_1NG462857 [Panicum virgatum]
MSNFWVEQQDQSRHIMRCLTYYKYYHYFVLRTRVNPCYCTRKANTYIALRMFFRRERIMKFDVGDVKAIACLKGSTRIVIGHAGGLGFAEIGPGDDCSSGRDIRADLGFRRS